MNNITQLVVNKILILWRKNFIQYGTIFKQKWIWPSSKYYPGIKQYGYGVYFVSAFRVQQPVVTQKLWIDIFSEMSKKIDRMDGENQFNYKELYMCQIWCLLICQCVVFIIVKMSDEMVAWICFF